MDNANRLLADQPELAKLSPEELFKNLDKAPEAIRTGLRNNVGGAFESLLVLADDVAQEGGGRPSGRNAKAVEKEFRSFDEFQKQFNDAAAKRFGSGWAWLVAKDGKLVFSHGQSGYPGHGW